ncbi:MAG TPA: hypothetical protein VD998_00535, partial [Verrucomicrobiae bacterium]|nr:hypothetical protein [Verrucomicrobiae bacterium]
MSNNKSESGQMIIFVIIFSAVLLVLISSLVDYAAIQSRSHRSAVAREQALSIAEAGIEKAIWKLNNQIGYGGETGATFANGTYDITVTNLSGSSRLIRAEAYVPNSTNPRAKRVVQVTATIGTTNVGFNYGVQVGNGGLELTNSARIVGNVY